MSGKACAVCAGHRALRAVTAEELRRTAARWIVGRELCGECVHRLCRARGDEDEA